MSSISDAPLPTTRRPERPAGADLVEDEAYLRSLDQTALFLRRVRPAGEARARLLWVHGVAEHGGRYLETLRHFARAGFDCAVVDLRGHGRSGGRRVFVRRWSDYLDDVLAAFRYLNEDRAVGPWFALGHSMGGLVLTRTLQERLGVLPALRGAVILSPYFGLALELPRWKTTAGRALSRALPWAALPTGLDTALLSKDPAVCEAYERDPMVSKSATARWFTEATGAQPLVFAEAPRLGLPLLVMHGEDDRLTCPRASARFVERVGSQDKELRLWPGLRHELLNEVERAAVREHIQGWLEQRL